MRESDRVKILHSYTTVWNQAKQRWDVKQDTWLPGYTSAHKKTPEEAIEYRIDMLKLEQKKLVRQIADLQVYIPNKETN